MKTKYCTYCRTWRDPQGFRTVTHAGTKTTRFMCVKCQEIRTKPRSVLEELAQRAREERKKK